MGYLDNLENSLKALESREEADPARRQREHQQRLDNRDAAVRRAPHARALKASAFTGQLLGACRKFGPAMGVYVQITWAEDNLRLDARGNRLELVPTADGVIAVYAREGEETSRHPVDVEGDGEAFARAWLELLPGR